MQENDLEELPLYGNKNYNLINGGIAVYDSINSVYYYSASGYDQGIYSYNPETNEILKMCDDEAQYINLVQNRLFYVNVSDGYKIYSIGIDGSDRQVVVDVDSDYLVYYDKYLYYRNNNDNGYLYKTSIDDMVSELIYDNRITYINVTDDYIGFINEQVGFDVYLIWHDNQINMQIELLVMGI